MFEEESGQDDWSLIRFFYNQHHPGKEIESLHLDAKRKDVIRCWVLENGGEDMIAKLESRLMETV